MKRFTSPRSSVFPTGSLSSSSSSSSSSAMPSRAWATMSMRKKVMNSAAHTAKMAHAMTDRPPYCTMK